MEAIGSLDILSNQGQSDLKEFLRQDGALSQVRARCGACCISICWSFWVRSELSSVCREMISLAQLQKRAAGDSLIVEEVSSSSWRVSMVKATLLEKKVNLMIFYCVEEDFDVGQSRVRDRLQQGKRRVVMLLRDAVRRVGDEVNDIKGEAKAEEHMTSCVVNGVDNGTFGNEKRNTFLMGQDFVFLFP